MKQYQAGQDEKEELVNMAAAAPATLTEAAEPKFRYGAEAFEAYRQEAEKTMSDSKAGKAMPVKAGKSR